MPIDVPVAVSAAIAATTEPIASLLVAIIEPTL
jgi:hypothetical protein